MVTIYLFWRQIVLRRSAPKCTIPVTQLPFQSKGALQSEISNRQVRSLRRGGGNNHVAGRCHGSNIRGTGKTLSTNRRSGRQQDGIISGARATRICGISKGRQCFGRETRAYPGARLG